MSQIAKLDDGLAYAHSTTPAKESDEFERDLNIAIMASLVSVKANDDQQHDDVIDISSDQDYYYYSDDDLGVVIDDDDDVTEVINVPSTPADKKKKIVVDNSATDNRQFSNSVTEKGQSSKTTNINSLFVCDICCELKDRKESSLINGCTHIFCTNCISDYVADKLQEDVTNICCPGTGCAGLLQPLNCRSFLPKELFDRWCNVLCEALILGSVRVHCPFKDCSAMMVADELVVTQSECPTCQRLFCAQCKVPWHSGYDCDAYQALPKNPSWQRDGKGVQFNAPIGEKRQRETTSDAKNNGGANYSKVYVMPGNDSDAGGKFAGKRSYFQGKNFDPRVANFIFLICNKPMQQVMNGFNGIRPFQQTLPVNGGNTLSTAQQPAMQASGGAMPIQQGMTGFSGNITMQQGMQGSGSNVEWTSRLGMLNRSTNIENPLHLHYLRLRCDLEPLAIGSREFDMIEKYIRNTGDQHYVDIVNIFRTSRESENERFKKFSGVSNRKLLWHGSRLANWPGILSQGLCIAPRNVATTGHQFGKGLYFADTFSKSAFYSTIFGANTDAVLALCEVALGEVNVIGVSDRSFGSHQAKYPLPDGFLSSMATGNTEPDPSQSQVLEDGVVVPLGRLITQRHVGGAMRDRNEYIVFNEAQVRMRYIVHVKLVYKTPTQTLMAPIANANPYAYANAAYVSSVASYLPTTSYNASTSNQPNNK